MSYDIRFGVKVDGMNGYIAVIDKPDGCARIPHWATCPFAEDFRR